MKTITSQQVLEFCRTDAWHNRKYKLLLKYRDYLDVVCETMIADNEQAMNDAALRVDYSLRLKKGATVVPEIISCYLTSLRSRVKS